MKFYLVYVAAQKSSFVSYVEEEEEEEEKLSRRPIIY
jgi:hypothetical protein